MPLGQGNMPHAEEATLGQAGGVDMDCMCGDNGGV